MYYQKLGLEILARVGGKGNVSKLTHCATRLRMEFNDDAKVDSKAIEALPGVISVVVRGGQFQIVVGQPQTGAQKQQPKGGVVSRIISVISTTFTPVIPAITGAGMIKALLAILKLAGAIDPAGTTYRLLDTVADAA
ncbi:PTS transporter subunit EIIB, partial [Serratia bockelmannii]|nr:PTS transporter subunit EIIB [Serratia bockelmannii]